MPVTINTIANKLKMHIRYYSKIFVKPYIKTNMYGIKHYINPQSALDVYIEKHDALDDWDLLKRIKDAVPKDGVVFDIGANVGHMTLLFAKEFVPSGRVFAYEPDPDNFKNCKKNIDLNDFQNITLIQEALQENNDLEFLNFNIRRAIDGSGNQNRGISSLKAIKKFHKETISVKVSTLDKEVKRLEISSLNFIKIDVEGAEFNVLSGGEETIRRFQPIIQYEYSNVLDRLTNEKNTEKTFLLLDSLGYTQYFLDESNTIVRLTKADCAMKDANILCFPKGSPLPF